jgi:hypothetical protein
MGNSGSIVGGEEWDIDTKIQRMAEGDGRENGRTNGRENGRRDSPRDAVKGEFTQGRRNFFQSTILQAESL